MTAPRYPVATAADLRREVPRLAIADLPLLLPMPKSELEWMAADRDHHLERLSAVPEKVRAWVSDHADREVMRIAAARQRFAAQPHPDQASGSSRLHRGRRWYPLTDARRAVLGEQNARALLFRAEEMRGRSHRDPQLAARLADLDLAAEPFLKGATDRLDAAVGATASQNALEVRNMIDSTRAKSVESNSGRVVDEPFRPPIERYEKELGPFHRDLSLASFAAAKHLARCDDHSLRSLASETAKSWRRYNFDPALAAQRAREQIWGELGEIDEEISKLPELGSPDRILDDRAIADAVIHSASHQLLFERSIEGPSIGGTRDLEGGLGV